MKRHPDDTTGTQALSSPKPPIVTNWQLRVNSNTVNDGAPPISKLVDELLMEIFKLNANMDDHDQEYDILRQFALKRPSRAVTITLTSSQVCRLWRNIINKSSFLWANLIDLDFLDVVGEYWRKEILDRAHEIPLRVKGSVDLNLLNESPYPSKPWWEKFITYRGSQKIRIFDVALVQKPKRQKIDARGYKYYDTMDSLSKHALCPSLLLSNKNIESFCVKLLRAGNPTTHSEALFFGNNAPRLRSFETHNVAINHLKNPKISWLSNLQDLTIIRDGGSITSLNEFYQILAQIPHLRSLCLGGVITKSSQAHNGPDLNRAPIHFQFLNRIEICAASFSQRQIPYHGSGGGGEMMETMAPSLCWNVLDFIIPKPGCSIQLWAWDFEPSNIDQAAAISGRYVKNYLEIHHPTNLTWISKQKKFRLTDLQNITEKTGRRLGVMKPSKNQREPFLDFNIIVRNGRTAGCIFEELCSSSLSFSIVTDLELDIHPGERAQFSDSQLADLLASFSHVERLTISFETVYFLVNSPVIDLSTPFPRLRDLNMAERDGWEWYSMRSSLGIECSYSREELRTIFLNRRKDAGVQVSTSPLPVNHRRVPLFLDSKLPSSVAESSSSLENRTKMKSKNTSVRRKRKLVSKKVRK